MPLTRLKMAVFAPMPSASVSTAMSREAGTAAQQAHAVPQVLKRDLRASGRAIDRA